MRIVEHIGIFDGFVAPDICDALVAAFERAHELNYTYTRQQSENVTRTEKQDIMLAVHNVSSLDAAAIGLSPVSELMSLVWTAYKQYADVYDLQKTSARHTLTTSCKIQKTIPTGGYHVWHYEASARDVVNRVAAFIVYLNDVADGGETEFLYQSMRVKPTKGTVVIFPASYTHTHRGNPPLSGDKYIATSWFEFIE